MAKKKQQQQGEQEEPVVIVGGGLVGALETLVYARKRKVPVHLYEARPDIRKEAKFQGRSINLALSTRGIRTLEEIGIADLVVKDGLPMYGRMIHNIKGETHVQPYGLHGEAILSIDRRRLNEVLLTEAEKESNVKMFFDHKCEQVDFDTRTVYFRHGDKKVANKASFIIGADGVYSTVRRQLMRATRMNYQQFYIADCYKELAIPADENGNFKMSHENLHIWPRHSFMMIALPNQDRSFTCTLFAPISIFDSLTNREELLAFFEKYFPDAIPLMGAERLVEDFFANPTNPLMTVKCYPYHYKDFAVIIGDAAHAMVPFYGQGMNAGFQDCLVLDQTLSKYDDMTVALENYSITRNPAAVAICDLAMENYVEMRHKVTSRWFLFHKTIINALSRIFPSKFIPLYTMVSFTEIPYDEVTRRNERQDRFVNILMTTVATGLVGGAACLAVLAQRHFHPDTFHSITSFFSNNK